MSVTEEFDNLVDKQDYEGALAVLTKAWHSQYETSFYLSNMGWTLNQLERPLEALIHLSKAITLYPNDAWNYSQIGYSYQLIDRYEDALTYYRKAIKYGSDDVWVNSRIAYILFEEERYEEAITYYENALMDSPEDMELRASLGNCYCNLRQFDKAYDEWLIVVKRTRDEHLIEACVLSLFQEGDYDTAEKLMKYMPDVPLRYYLDAVIAFEHGMYSDVVRSANLSLDNDIEHTGIHQLLSDAYFKLGNEEEAIHHLRVKRGSLIKALDIQGEGIDLLRHIAVTSLTCGDYDVAEEYLARALKMDPNDPTSLYFYCNALVYNTKYEEALSYFKKLRKVDGDSFTAESMYNEAYSYFYLEDYEEAIRVVKRFRELNPHELDGFMLELLAESHYNLGDYKNCVKECLNSIGLDSTRLSVYQLMASANEHLEDYDAVVASITAANERNIADDEFREFASNIMRRIASKSESN